MDLSSSRPAIRMKKNDKSNYDQSTWPQLNHETSKRISKKRGQKLYMLNDPNMEGLPWVEGPTYKFKPSHLYRCTELQFRAWEVYGGPGGFEFAQNMHKRAKEMTEKIGDRAKKTKNGVKHLKDARRERSSQGFHKAGRGGRSQYSHSDRNATATTGAAADDVIELTDSTPPSSPSPVTPRRDLPASGSRNSGTPRQVHGASIGSVGRIRPGSKATPIIVIDSDAEDSVVEWSDDKNSGNSSAEPKYPFRRFASSEVIELTDSE
ncbi:hypothetical protein CVT26_011134 [Gymnopilus dilepis]|uniref:Uncharacterized protein n=1 Tax=Gymnopilus dilepis TaxID=231916 RepID=A0A409VYV1_9AGAR|nr:hypothetical protein CVT26_011134 [Gymnopilus dilepis]